MGKCLYIKANDSTLKQRKNKMIVAILTNKTDIRNQIIIRLDNNYAQDCVADLSRIDAFLNKVSLDVATTLVKKDIAQATSQDVNDAIFGEVFGRKGLRTGLLQSSQGLNRDKIAEDHLETVDSINGLLRDKNTGKLFVNGKLLQGSLKQDFVPKSIVTRIKDLMKLRLNLECSKWVRVGVDSNTYDLEIRNNDEVLYSI